MSNSVDIQNKISSKIENLKAHYSALRGNVNQLNEELGEITRLRDESLLEKAYIEDEIETKQSQLFGLRRTLSNTQTELKETIQEIEDAKDKKIEIEEEHEESLDALLAAIEDREAKLKSLDKEFKSQYREYSLKLLTKKMELSRVENQLDELHCKISEGNAKHEDVLKSIADSARHLQSTKDRINEEYKEHRKRGERIKERERELRDRFTEYNERMKELEIKEADAKVYFNRLKAAYKKIKPGVVIKI